MSRPAFWSLAFAFVTLVACTSSEEPSDAVCPTGRLPTEGTACDPVRMPANTYCRLASCGWGSERECACRDGKWRCTDSSRDDYGCGTPPFCEEKTSATCPGEDAGVDANKPDATYDDPSCPQGRLPTAGTACDPKLMPPGSYCRLESCDWGGEDDCTCESGKWKCTMSFRDGLGCGTPPRCFEQGSPYCTGTADGGTCLGSMQPLYALGPWNTTKSCWPTTQRFFECVSGIDGGTMPTCFVYMGQFYLSSTTQIPSDARPCTDAERAAHGTYQRCE